jgi:hypothetical protein
MWQGSVFLWLVAACLCCVTNASPTSTQVHSLDVRGGIVVLKSSTSQNVATTLRTLDNDTSTWPPRLRFVSNASSHRSMGSIAALMGSSGEYLFIFPKWPSMPSDGVLELWALPAQTSNYSFPTPRVVEQFPATLQGHCEDTAYAQQARAVLQVCQLINRLNLEEHAFVLNVQTDTYLSSYCKWYFGL